MELRAGQRRASQEIILLPSVLVQDREIKRVAGGIFVYLHFAVPTRAQAVINYLRVELLWRLPNLTNKVQYPASSYALAVSASRLLPAAFIP